MNIINCFWPPAKFGYLQRKRLLSNSKVYFLIMGLFLLALTSEAQVNQRTLIRGELIGAEKREPITAASVQVKGSGNGTITDSLGHFSLSDITKGQTLVISSLGSEPIEVPVSRILALKPGESFAVKNSFIERNSAGRLIVGIAPSSTLLEETVVIGYGTMKKVDLTGSVSTVKGNLIAEKNVNQVSQALQGLAPGVMVTRNNNAPGSSASIRIRGITTIGDSDPLILVDGVPASDIDNINPNDIENISVLKDAASASIYGSRAAAGVILVTTKRGKENQLELGFTYNRGIEKPTNLPPYADAVRYMKMVNELRWNDIGNIPGSEFPVYTEDVINNYANLHIENPDVYPNTDWMDLLLKDQANRESYLLNLTGGSKTVQSRVSIGYDQTDGLYIGKGFERITARLNNNIVISKHLKGFVDLNLKRSTFKDPSESPMTNAYRSAPVYAAIWSDGLVGAGKDGNNMYAQLLLGGNTTAFNNEIGARAGLEFSPLNGLKFTALIAPEFNFNKSKAFRKKVQYTNYDDPNVYAGSTDWGGTTSLTEVRNEFNNVTGQILVNYDKSFGNHNLSVMGGFESYHYSNESISASTSDMNLDSYPYLDLGNPNNLANTGTAYENAYMSYFGRVAYNYKNKYLLQGNIRYDGSSRFYKDYRWGAFPSFSAGWVLSKEHFMDKIPFISFLKLRGSWGLLGNERIGNYPYQSIINFGNALLYQGPNIVSAQTAAQYAYAIQNISWETTSSYNIGFDVNFFNNRLGFVADFYKKTTRDMLLELEIPDYMGYSNPQQNTGKMFTNGWELSANWNDHLGKLKYSLSFNISDFKSIMGDLGGIQFLGNQVKMKGSEFNEWYGYKSLGLYQSQEEVDGSAVLTTGVRPGDVKYADISGPEGKPDGIISEYDKTLLGGSLPRYMYGGIINLEYANFDFSLSFQGVAKQESQITANMVQPYQGSWGNMPLEIEGKYWSVNNTPEQNQKAVYPRITNNLAGNNYALSDFWLFNGAYFRLKNLVLGYTLPASVLGNFPLKNLRVYGSVSDVLSINKYPDGWDPEVANTGYPITTSYNFGVSIKF